MEESQSGSLSAPAEVVLALVQRHGGGVSMVEITNALEAAGHPGKGDLEMSHPTDSNLVMWSGVSEIMVEALNELLSAKLVHYAPTTPLTYLIDGGALTLPVAQRPPKSGYKEPHWIPMVINSGPAPD